jgi:hypothetical protein
MFSTSVVLSAALLIVTNLIWYANYPEDQRSGTTLTCFILCMGLSLIGILLALWPRGSPHLASLGCTLQFVNLLWFSYPMYGELP